MAYNFVRKVKMKALTVSMALVLMALLVATLLPNAPIESIFAQQQVITTGSCPPNPIGTPQPPYSGKVPGTEKNGWIYHTQTVNDTKGNKHTVEIWGIDPDGNPGNGDEMFLLIVDGKVVGKCPSNGGFNKWGKNSNGTWWHHWEQGKDTDGDGKADAPDRSNTPEAKGEHDPNIIDDWEYEYDFEKECLKVWHTNNGTRDKLEHECHPPPLAELPPVAVNTTRVDQSVAVCVLVSDVAVTDVLPSKTVVAQGYSLNTSVLAANLGNFTETFNVTLCANTTEIQTREITLSRENSATITFTWNTADFGKGNYTIWAYALPVPNETEITDNGFIDGWVVVTIIGDINGDFKVDIKDIVLVIKAFASYPSHPKWNPNADVNSDLKVDVKDLVLTIKHFGQHYP